MKLLAAYPWPGNVRQLQNVLRRCMALAGGEVLRSDDLPDDICGVRGEPGDAVVSAAGTFAEARERHVGVFERGYLEAALRDSLGEVSRASERSGIPRATFYRMLKKHGVDPDRFRAG
jgi:transcriptional regulator of acetoin/glycerol metabolism